MTKNNIDINEKMIKCQSIYTYKGYKQINYLHVKRIY